MSALLVENAEDPGPGSWTWKRQRESSNNVEATTWKRQRKSDSVEVVNNVDATTWKWQDGKQTL